MTGIAVVAETMPRQDEILTGPALASRRQPAKAVRVSASELLMERQARRQRISEGGSLDFLAETRVVRESDWTFAPSLTSPPWPLLLPGSMSRLAGVGGAIWRVADHIRTNVEACESRDGGSEISGRVLVTATIVI